MLTNVGTAGRLARWLVVLVVSCASAGSEASAQDCPWYLVIGVPGSGASYETEMVRPLSGYTGALQGLLPAGDTEVLALSYRAVGIEQALADLVVELKDHSPWGPDLLDP